MDDLALKREFFHVFPQLVDVFVESLVSEYGLTREVQDRTSRMIHYNVSGGKCNRGLSVLIGTRDLCREKKLDFADRIASAAVLGWAIEFLQACFLVADDIMDRSITRRGKPCWYRVEEVQFDAVNDAFILESCLYFLLKKFCRHESWYLTVLEMYHDVALKTEVGQMLDLLSQPQGRKGPEVLAQFSKKRLEQIVDYKTAFYTFYVPLASALLVSGFEEDRHLKLANDIAILLGRKFQTQDDYLDCFADPKHLGKVGTDIQDHKCTWLLVHALELVAPEQRRVIEENLGREDEASIARIKQLYLDLGLDKLYAKHEQDTYEEIINISKENADLVPPVLFTLMLDQIHLRTK